MNARVSSEIVNALKGAGVDSVAMLPDHGFSHLQDMVAAEPTFTYIPISNEGIGIGVCGGLYLGGKVPAIIIPTSGLLTSVWPLASLHQLWGIPLILLISYRGDVGDAFWIMKTYKFTTEPVLDSLQIPYVIVRETAQIKGAIKDALESAFAWQNPVCVLFSGETLR
jgi:sulfopyruvate decarboxylase subunit alpha